MKETPKPVRKPRTPAVSKSAVKPAVKPAGKPAAKPAATKGQTAVRKTAAGARPQGKQPPAGQDDKERIRLAAYYLAERRGFVSGHELEDWLAAEAAINKS
jgi:hypothetical protein